MPQGNLALVVDACVAINIRATGRWREIFVASGWRPLMTSTALREVLYLFDDDGERQQVSLDADEVTGHLDVCDLTETQIELMLRFIPALGPGEASSLAIAITDGMAVATDDLAAQRHEDARGIRIVTTSELMHRWSEGLVPTEDVRNALSLIESRARFRPGASDAHNDWWLSLFG